MIDAEIYKKDSAFEKRRISNQLVLAWLIIFGGCLLSFWTWYYLERAAGNYRYNMSSNFIGWSQSFFVNHPGLLIFNLTRWLVMFFRAVGAVLAGIFLSKFQHKLTVCIAFLLIIFSLPLLIVAFPFKGNKLTLYGVSDDEITVIEPSSDCKIATQYSLIGYFLFTIFRSFLAIGGTVLIVCTQPIFAQLKKSANINSVRFNSLSFSIAFIGATVPFLFCASFNYFLVKYWYFLSIIVISLIVCFLLFYILFAENITPNITNFSKMFISSDMQKGTVFKNPDTWKLAFLHGTFTFIILFPMSPVMKNIIQTSFANLSISRNFKIFFNTISINRDKLWMIWKCFFIFGISVGYFLISSFSNTRYERRYFLLFTSLTGFIFLIISIVFGYSGYANSLFLFFHFFFIFLAGIFLWGSESVIMNIPHELPKNNHKQVSLMVGLIIGISYFFFIFVDVPLSLLTTFNRPRTCANLCDPWMRITHVLTFLIFLFFIFFVLFFILFLPETGSYLHGDWLTNNLPWKIWNWNFNRTDICVVSDISIK